jgi:hypothetical protein
LECGEAFSCAAGERDDPFALVAVERFLPGSGGLIAATGGLENFGQIEVNRSGKVAGSTP